MASINFDDVISKSDTIKKVEQEEAENYINEAKELIAKGELKESISLLRKSIYIYEENADAYFLLGRVYIKSGNRPYGMGLMEHALVFDNATEEMFKEVVNMAIMKREYSKALDLMSRMQDKFRGDPELSGWIEGKVRYLLNNTDTKIGDNIIVKRLLQNIVKDEMEKIRAILQQIMAVYDSERSYDADKAEVERRVNDLKKSMDVLVRSMAIIIRKNVNLKSQGEIMEIVGKIKSNIGYIEDGYVLSGASLVGDLVEKIESVLKTLG